MRKLATRVSVLDIQRIWATSLTRGEISQALGISRASLDRLAKLHKLPKKKCATHSRRVVPPDPDESAVTATASQLRKKWSKNKTKRRSCGLETSTRKYSFGKKLIVSPANL